MSEKTSPPPPPTPNESAGDKPYKFYPLKIELDEFVKQAETAATRTRWTMIVLVLASVLIGIGFYNTTPLSFAPEGITSLNKFENLPINNLAEQEGKPLPLLDSYFGENDFADTKFEKRYLSRLRTGDFTGLRRMACDQIYVSRYKAGSLGQYLYYKFNPATQYLLTTECGTGRKLTFPEDPIKFNYLTTDLNKILGDKYLYNERRFPEYVINRTKKPNVSGIFNYGKIDLSKNELSYLKIDLSKFLSDSYLYNELRFFQLAVNIKVRMPVRYRRNHAELRRLLAEWKEAKKEEKSKSASAAAVDSKLRVTPTVSPTPEDEAILSSKAKEVDVSRLNRLLLEAAFPGEINESTDIIPPREARLARELATHLAFDDKVRYLNIPFFDASIEINDLGAFGGIALMIILLLLRFSLSREIKNMNIAFRQAFYKDELSDFYHKLAMRLVIIVPKMEGESVNQPLSVGAKYICFLAPLVLTAGVWYDSYSINTLGLYKADEVWQHFIVEIACVFFVWYLSLRCLERLMHIDEIWEDYHLIWEQYLERGIESHTDLLARIPSSDFELDSAINRRVYNKSKEGRLFNYGRFLAWWGRKWIGRLLTLTNLARLMPIKPLNNLVKRISKRVWILFLKLLFLIKKRDRRVKKSDRRVKIGDRRRFGERRKSQNPPFQAEKDT